MRPLALEPRSSNLPRIRSMAGMRDTSVTQTDICGKLSGTPRASRLTAWDKRVGGVFDSCSSMSRLPKCVFSAGTTVRGKALPTWATASDRP